MSVCFLLLDSALSHLYAPFGTRRSLHCIFFRLFSTELRKWTNAAVKTLLTFRCKIRMCDPQGQIRWYSVISGPHRLLCHAYWALNYKHCINDMMSRCWSEHEADIKNVPRHMWTRFKSSQESQTPHQINNTNHVCVKVVLHVVQNIIWNMIFRASYKIHLVTPLIGWFFFLHESK